MCQGSCGSKHQRRWLVGVPLHETAEPPPLLKPKMFKPLWSVREQVRASAHQTERGPPATIQSEDELSPIRHGWTHWPGWSQTRSFFWNIGKWILCCWILRAQIAFFIYTFIFYLSIWFRRILPNQLVNSDLRSSSYPPGFNLEPNQTLMKMLFVSSLWADSSFSFRRLCWVD